MKFEKILLSVVILSILALLGLLLVGGTDFAYWREVTSVLSVIFGLALLTFLLHHALHHEEDYHVTEDMLYDFGDGIDYIYCDNCGEMNKKTDLFCHNCNYDLRVIVCPICGNENPYHQKYCLNCDSKLIAEEEEKHES